MLELSDFFNEINNEIYSVVKLSSEFPRYNKGSDVDIFCFNAENIAKKILYVGNKYINKGYEVVVNSNAEKIYIDFYIDSKIDFRFDLYKKLPSFNNINIKPSLFETIVENSICKEINSECKIFVPNQIDELIIRYIEYHEWYAQRPDKIKHIDYIISAIENDLVSKSIFLNKLHYYTEFKPNIYKKEKYVITTNTIYIPRICRFVMKIPDYLKKIRSRGILGIIIIPLKSITFRLNKRFFK